MQVEKRHIYPVDLKDAGEALDMIVEKIGCSKADAIRDAIRYYADYLSGLEVVRYREIGKEDAKEEIKTYIKGKDRVSADEISDGLRIDMSMINEVLLELWEEGWVEPDE
ncbi:MAG: winged helix-turn-helix domain-containing protein [Euryarchaeota archaeon]|nr:winged helix-turn-helix domain-containing protein [Euryarchaeota archaeon]